MAVLTGELSSSQGIPSTSIASLQSFFTVSASAALDSLLVSYGLISTSAGTPLQSSLSAIALAVVSQGSYQNYLSRLARFFGVNAKQDANYLYIQKSDLILLIPRVNNTAESLFIALLLQVEQFESNSLISTVLVELFKQEFVSRNNQVYINSLLLVKLYTSVIYVNRSNPDIANQIMPATPLTPNSF